MLNSYKEEVEEFSVDGTDEIISCELCDANFLSSHDRRRHQCVSISGTHPILANLHTDSAASQSAQVRFRAIFFFSFERKFLVLRMENSI